ncbi:MAG TPA: hypothetical protein VGO30_19910 [Mycobacterium sp.]|jgi:hypothetical protein|nr:hypothetical protein [Mycobacterium sp.]
MRRRTDFQNFAIFNPAALHDDAAEILFDTLKRGWRNGFIRPSAHEAASWREYGLDTGERPEDVVSVFDTGRTRRTSSSQGPA